MSIIASTFEKYPLSNKSSQHAKHPLRVSKAIRALTYHFVVATVGDDDDENDK